VHLFRLGFFINLRYLYSQLSSLNRYGIQSKVVETIDQKDAIALSSILHFVLILHFHNRINYGNWRGMKKFSLVFICAILALYGCEVKTSVALPTLRPTLPFTDSENVSREEVQMTTSNGVKLKGTIYGDGEV
jgi:hypothetical protein